MKTIIPFFLFILLGFCCLGQRMQKISQDLSSSRITPAAERMDLYLPLLKGKSVGVFANQTSQVAGSHLVDTLLSRGIQIKKIFAPEHGFRGNADAGENVNNLKDEKTGIQIISLYGSRQKPTSEDLADLDILLFDIQDVGTRFYTYISSLQKFIEAALENDKPLIILDRPNPNGFYIDGPVLDMKFKSFVGMQPVPVVYGMTIGEYGAMLVGEHWLTVSQYGKFSRTDEKKQGQRISEDSTYINTSTLVLDNHPGFYLKIICSKNYSHKSKYLLPVAPSPNLPNMQSVYLYPSLCFFEGTAISLGRGTSKPFQQFGSPLFPENAYSFTPESLPGAKKPPLLNQNCYAVDLSTIDVLKEINNQIQLKWLFEAYRLFPDKNAFFLSTNYFNTLAGTDLLMQQIKNAVTEDEIRKSWEPGLEKFKGIRVKYLLYP